MDLSRAKLQAATFYKADANRAILKDADLRAANLRGAQLQDARFQRAQLQGASLMEAQLEQADFSDSKLGLARLDHASVSKTVFEGADLNNVIAVQSNPFPNPLPGKAKLSPRTAPYGAKLSQFSLKASSVRCATRRSAASSTGSSEMTMQTASSEMPAIRRGVT